VKFSVIQWNISTLETSSHCLSKLDYVPDHLLKGEQNLQPKGPVSPFLPPGTGDISAKFCLSDLAVWPLGANGSTTCP